MPSYKHIIEHRTKCIGITIETRPDYCLKPHLSEMLSYGCTRIEIGVQSIYEDVARDTNRYCTTQYCTTQYCTVLYCTVLYCTVLYCTVLNCTEVDFKFAPKNSETK